MLTLNNKYIMLRMKNIFAHFLCLIMALSALVSCAVKENESSENISRMIDVLPIYQLGTRGDSSGEVLGYHCTSSSSDVVCDVYPDLVNSQANATLYDQLGEQIASISFAMEKIQSDGSCKFMTFNELNEPLVSGVYNQLEGYIVFDCLFGNDIVTKSTTGWICNMSLGTAGAIWSAAAGMASLGAGFVVGLAFTAFTYWFCDTAEKNMQQDES
jgi:hypothetical protein